jgi:hypothetical protein
MADDKRLVGLVITFVILNRPVGFLTEGEAVESECISSLLGALG